MSCIICNSPTEVLFVDLHDRLHFEISGEYTVKRCLNCSLVFIDPQPMEEELESHYPQQYHVYQRTPSLSAKKLTIAKLVANEYFSYGKSRWYLKPFLVPFYFKLLHLPYFVKTGRLLDIGCGEGSRLLMFKELGWNVEGLEMNLKTAARLQDIGYKIYIGQLEKINLPRNYFDVVHQIKICLLRIVSNFP